MTGWTTTRGYKCAVWITGIAAAAVALATAYRVQRGADLYIAPSLMVALLLSCVAGLLLLLKSDPWTNMDEEIKSRERVADDEFNATVCCHLGLNAWECSIPGLVRRVVADHLGFECDRMAPSDEVPNELVNELDFSVMVESLEMQFGIVLPPLESANPSLLEMIGWVVGAIRAAPKQTSVRAVGWRGCDK